MLGIDMNAIMQPVTEMNKTLVGLMREMNEKLDEVVQELRELNNKE